jgi:cobalamin biosynthesis protein CobW
MQGTAKVPVTVITGFLGAGKTSLVRHLLEKANGRRLALIINEFGDLGVDGDILKGCGVETCGEGDVVELTNGCLCCTVADDFIPTLESLLDRAERLDHIVIETSGLALPKPLVKAFHWPEIRSRTTVDGVVTVVDGPAVRAGLFAADPQALQTQREADEGFDHDSPLEELFSDQLACADLVVLGKTDLMDAAGEGEVREIVERELRPAVKALAVSHGRLDPTLVLGLDAAVEDDIEGRKSVHDDLDGEHDHDDFESFVFDVDAIAEPAQIAARVTKIMALPGVLRVKGALEVADRPARLVIQGVGPRVEHYYDRPWAEGEGRAGRLVVIGLSGLDRAAIEAGLKG